jgi:fibrillarin-like pre-rRNA processing protein
MGRFRNHPKFDGVFLLDHGQQIYTKNLDKGNLVYGEKIILDNDIEYREWNPYRSKLGAIIVKKIRNIYFKDKSRCLYLGASSGTTVSHLSDMLINGIIYAIEFSPRSLRELIQNCETRANVIPIIGDANQPQEYAKFIFGSIDIIYQDVAQPNQSEIAINNAQKFLKNGGILIITIKARSINVAEKPENIFIKELEVLRKADFEILEKMDISPYTKDHLVVIARYFGN